jgi:hypothetical protein
MDARTRILEIIKIRGPVTPTQISKELKVDSYVASAMLSELVSSKYLRISRFRLGSSPVYFLPEQDSMLDNFVSCLNEKDRKTAAFLKEKHVLQDSAQDPLTRVSLRNIKDFAIPLEVSHEGKSDIFWKYHALPQADTEEAISELLGIGKKKELPEAIERKPEKKDEQKRIVEEKPDEELGCVKADAKKAPGKPKSLIQKGEFAANVSSYFRKNDIIVAGESVIRKNNLEYVIRLPSAVGELTYFCVALDKVRLDEADLASVYVKAENQKLPALIITTGELTKPAKIALERDFKKVAVKKI